MEPHVPGGADPGDGPERPLSQAEIDALMQSLQPTAPVPKTAEPAAAPPPVERVDARPRQLPPALERLASAELNVAVELGRTVVEARRVLQWGVGAVVVLDARWSGPVAITINGRPAGTGRVVASEMRYGVQIEDWGTDWGNTGHA